MMTITTLLFLLFLIVLSSCQKDKLTGTYDRFEGKYQWIYSDYGYQDDPFCPLCPLTYHVDSASEASYTAQIEFTKSYVTFFIDNEVLVKKKLKIENQSEDGGTLYVDLKVDVNKDMLDIDDRIEVYSASQDTIYLSGFPGDGYDSEFLGSNYFVRID